MSEEFQLPSWLANGEPIPDELLAKRSYTSHGIGVDEDDDEDEVTDAYHPSSFYGFSFIDLSGSSEDTWSVRSSNTPSLVNGTIRDEIKTCVDTLHSCLHQFREMNEQFSQEQVEIEQSVQQLISDLLDRLETPEIVEEEEEEVPPESPLLDYNLLNELLTKKLSLHEYLVLLDRLVDKNVLHVSSKSAEDLSKEIVLLAEEIEHYRMLLSSEPSLDLEASIFHRTFDNQYQQQFLANTQSNYSVLSFLQQSSSMDMSLLGTADFSSQMQSTLFTSTVQQSTSNGGKVADVGE